MIDLHTHTTESDGTVTPLDLVELAASMGLEALGISDHDTFAGFDQALPAARDRGIELICGIELSTKLEMPERKRPKSVHLLGYFIDQPPPPELREWLGDLLASRNNRNVRLVARLRSLGLDIDLDEVQALARTRTGRPHFARVLLRKGYVSTLQEAFDRYLDESAPGYVDRKEPLFAEGVARLRKGGALTSLAHPVRLAGRQGAREERILESLVEMGLEGIEVYHSDHTAVDTTRYLAFAKRYGLAITGGSDFHGAAKPGIHLGTGLNGNLAIPIAVLERLRGRLRGNSRSGAAHH